MKDFEILIVASHHRRPLIEEYVQGLPVTISFTPDYELSKGWKPDPYYAKLVQNQTGQLRCFKGHQDALRKATKNNILVLEDDAVPNRKDWLEVALKSTPLLKNFEVVSMHGRRPAPFEGNERWGVKNNLKIGEQKYKTFRKVKSPWGDGSELVFVFGSLGYLINKKTIDKMLSLEYVGLPMDLLIANLFKFILLDPSPFNHDRSQGSLID